MEERKAYETPTLEVLNLGGTIRAGLDHFSVITPGGETIGGGDVIPSTPGTGSGSDLPWDPGHWGGD